jgi:hypothetical protein
VRRSRTPAAEHDVLARVPARAVGAHRGWRQSQTGRARCRVSGARGDVMDPETRPPSVTDRLMDRAFTNERAVLEPSHPPRTGVRGEAASR